jgi:hypothetical protein
VSRADRFQEYWTIGEPFTCYQEGNATKHVKAGASGSYWQVNASGYGDYTNRVHYKLAMTIPGSIKQPPSLASPNEPVAGMPVFPVAHRTAMISTRAHASAMAWTSTDSRGRTTYAQASWPRTPLYLNAAKSARYHKIAMR